MLFYQIGGFCLIYAKVSIQRSPYKKVLLVDDVMTTGSSLHELAKTITKVGVESCDVLVLART
jgi:predicted amidophosphoribosyltransferase